MNEMNYSPIPVNYYQQYAGGQDFRPVTTTTRKSTKPIVVNREDLVTALAGASDEYKKALEESNTLMGALGKAVSDEQVARVLAAPTNKGRLESSMGWGQALSGALMSGLNTYGKLNQIKENKAAKEYEDAFKMASIEDTLRARQEAADLQNAVNNQTVTVTGMEKYNLPKDGSGSGLAKQQQIITLDNMRQDLEDIGTRFDSSFKNIDEMQKGSTRWGRYMTNAGWGIGVSDEEKQGRDDFEAWKGNIRNVLVNTNREAGSGSMSDADAARFEQKIGEAKTPAEARNILDAFQARMMQTPLQNLRNDYNQNLSSEDILNKYGASLVQQ